MKIKDILKKHKEEIQKEIKSNEEVINSSEARNGILREGQTEIKMFYVVGIGVIFTLIIIAILLGTTALPALFESLPIYTVPFVTLGSSVVIGTILNKVRNFTTKIKDTLKSITHAKTNAELKYEEVKNLVAIKQAKNRNLALGTVVNNIDKTLAAANTYSDLDIVSNDSKEIVKQNIDILNADLEVKTKELDILSAQEFISKQFSIPKFDKFYNRFIFGLYGAMLTMFDCWGPYGVATGAFEKLGTTSATLAFLSTAAVGFGTVYGVLTKREKDYEKAYKKLNQELGENAVSENSKVEDISEKVCCKTLEIAAARVKLSTNQIVMARIEDQESKVVVEPNEEVKRVYNNTSLYPEEKGYSKIKK